MSQESPFQLDANFYILYLMFAGLLASLLIYLVITFVVPAPEALANPWIPQIFGAMAAGIMMVALIFRRVGLNTRAGRSFVNLCDEQGQPNEARAFARYRIIVIANLAMGEAVALLGLVLHMLGTASIFCYTLFLMGAMLMLYLRPRRGEFTAYMTRLDAAVESAQ